MSGQNEASFLIQDSRQAQRLRNGVVAKRVERLYRVQIALSARSAAAGSQDQGEWVTLTANGSSENTEKAKNYILSLCVPETVQECQADQQSAEQLLSETSKLRDDLEEEFQTAILPSSSPGRVRVQGSASAVQQTIARIVTGLMAPSQQDAFPQPLHPPRPPSQSRCSPASTAGAFSPSPPPPSTSLSSTNDMEQHNRVTPHQLPNIPIPSGALLGSSILPSVAAPQKLSATERDDILQMIATDIETDGHAIPIPRGSDSSLREQAIQYFVSLNFPREKTEAVINSMGVGAEYDDILRRLNTLQVTARPMSNLSLSRPRTYTGEPVLSSSTTLRPIVIDGSNVAMRHGNGRVFSCRGIQIAVHWFRQKGHKDITVFVPQWRRETPRAEYPITDQEILNQLEIEKTLAFTPSRRIGNKRIVCYDDRFIVRLASETNGVIVSNDNFRDLAEENEGWRKTIEHRLVMFTFVNDIFMVPEDPLGKHGPTLTQLLQMEPPNLSSKGGSMVDQAGPKVCPYAERCTFGKRCRFYHPERDGRMDPSVLTSRSANSSPAPSERRHTSGPCDVQKDSANTQNELMASPGQPNASPPKPRTSPSFPSQQPPPDKRNFCPQDLKFYQSPEMRGYPQGQGVPQGYPQPLRDYYSHPEGNQGYSQKPQLLRIATSSSNTLSPQPLSLHHSPRHSNPTTPMGGGGGGTYPSHTFPIANLSTGRPRNVTDKIQTCISPTPAHGGSLTKGSDDDLRNFVPIAPNPCSIVPPHQHGVDLPPGLVPRGDYATPYPPMPYHTGNPHDIYSYNRPSSYQHHSYRVHANPYPPSNYMPGEVPTSHHRHHSPVRNSPPSGHMPSQMTNTYHNRQSTDLSSLPENLAYITGNSLYRAQDQPLLHYQGGQMPSNRSDYRTSHSPMGDPHYPLGPRAASLYGEAGPKTAQEKAGIDKFQCSQSSPELYRNRSSACVPSSGSNINWEMFKRAQAQLPNQEQRIMDVMVHNPDVDLERLVELVQHTW